MKPHQSRVLSVAPMMDCADRWCRQFRRRLSRRALLSTETVTSAAVIHVARHMLGLFQGRPGARAFRRILTEGAVEPGAGLEVLDAALAALRRPARSAA